MVSDRLTRKVKRFSSSFNEISKLCDTLWCVFIDFVDKNCRDTTLQVDLGHVRNFKTVGGGLHEETSDKNLIVNIM